MSRPGNSLAQAELHVREGEKRIAYQDAIVEGCEIAGDERAAGEARKMLPLLRTSLEVARVHLLIETAWLKTEPHR